MIQVGSKFRSYDFSHARDCYVEGVVKGFKALEGCERYVIRVDRKVWAGKEVENPYRGDVYPPVNGTQTMMGGATQFVELV